MEDTAPDEEVTVDGGSDPEKNYCLQQSDEAYSTAIKSQEEYDKQLLLLSTGLLGILVAFLKDIVHLNSAVQMPLLYWGFIMLGLTIIAVISSFQVSVYALQKARQYFIDRYNKVNYPFPEGPGNLVGIVNIAGGVFFFTGVVLVFTFLAMNLAHQNTGEPYEERRELSRGIGSKESDPPIQRRTWATRKESDHACPEGEHCSYQYSETEEIGDFMTNRITVGDGLPPKMPAMLPHSGPMPKKPITTGTIKKEEKKK